MYEVISIHNVFGEKINLHHYHIDFVGENFVLATPKCFGNCFQQRFDSSNGYTVIIEKI